jgi:hypothetical protein
MFSLKSEKPRYTPRQDADRELPILATLIVHKNKAERQWLFLAKSVKLSNRKDMRNFLKQSGI